MAATRRAASAEEPASTSQPSSPSTPAPSPPVAAVPPARAPARRCNQLDGRNWLRNSISVWSDLRKSADEAKLGHPALFPRQLVERLLETFVANDRAVVLDPFAGSGSTIVAAAERGLTAVGLELSPEYAALGRRRLAESAPAGNRSCIHQESAFHVERLVANDSVDFCLTSPPYWNVLKRPRTADSKTIRHYGDHDGDLGSIASYEEYLDRLGDVFRQVFAALRPGAYCVVVVMDLRKKDRFFPLHSDLASRLVALGFEWDDLIVWNRQAEYNNLRPLGYPSVFRINKVHEYLLIFQKRAR